MFKLFSVPISVTTKLQALALVGEWVKEWRTAKFSEHSENSDGRKIRQSKNQKFRIQPSGSLNFRFSDSPGSPVRDVSPNGTLRPSIPSFPKIIVTPNPEMIVAAQTDPEFLKALQSADLAIPDGVGIVWALRILDKRETVDDRKWKVGAEDRSSKNDLSSNINRLSGLDFMESLINEAARRGWQVMFLGGRPGVAEKAAEKLQLPVLGYQLSDLSQPVVGLSVVEADEQKTDKPETENRKQITDNRLKIKSINGPEDVSHVSKFDNDRLITSINRVQPDLLFVAFGHGRQEKWLSANRYRLNAGVAMGVGGAFDQIADPSLRSPAYINSIGLGWLYRLIRQPWRIKRQLALVKFVGMVFRQKLQFSSSKLP